LQPYVIRQGDYLIKLAYQFGFDADTVWDDPQNQQLRQAGKLSTDPNILRPTDVLYIPSNAPPVTHALATGTANSYVSDAPTVNLSLKFTDPELASQAFTVNELPQLAGLTTQADGTTSFAVPVSQETLTLVFTSDGTRFTCSISQLYSSAFHAAHSGL
jgi:hypothetical protein